MFLHTVISIHILKLYIYIYIYIYISNTHAHTYAVELGYKVMKWTEYFVSLQTRIFITEEYSVMVSRGELFGATKYLAL